MRISDPIRRFSSTLAPRGTPASTAETAAQLASRASVRATTLANGLQLIVWSSDAIPNVVLNNWVRAGSRNESAGTIGLAHFFEHMMFNGTARRRPGEFDRLMEARGGSNNAYTSDDVTVYQDWFPREALELMLDLESDRIANLSFLADLIESERGVVYSERRLCVDDNNAGLLSERVQAAAFVTHPYRFPTIGYPADIKSWRMADLQRFFRTYYAPNNLTFVLAGDVQPQEVFRLARKYLEPIPRGESPPAVRVREPEQLGERRVSLRRKGRTPLLQYAFKAPAAGDRRGPAVNLLLATLVEGDGSRLHRLLVEQRKLAVEVSGEWQQGFDPGLLWLHLTLPEGIEPTSVERAVDAELARIAEQGVTPSELERAKNLVAASFWKQLATIDGRAHLLGEYELLRGGWRALFDAPQRYQAVTCAEVTAVARRVLDPRRRTVGVLTPIGADARP